VSPRLARLPAGDGAHGRRPLAWPTGRDRRPNVLYVVWDDATIAAWDAFGGLIDTPNMNWLAARGLRYSQWHTTALSSPTRSCLLTGRNCDVGGTAKAGRNGRGWSGSSVTIPPDTGTLAEILAENGYRSYCVGKWHLGPSEAPFTVAGSRRTWPLGRGFDHYYGFLGGQTHQWYPDLVYDNQYVDPPYPPADGYHLIRDLADMAVDFIRAGAENATGVPWLCYLSFGPNGVPYVTPQDWAERYRGRFEMGYDRYREIVLGKMKELGVVPANTGLAPADHRGIRGAAKASAAQPWHSLSDDHRQRCNRLAESYAGLCSYTDQQVGRVLDYLDESGQLDDTIVVACSANTAGTHGCQDGPSGDDEFLAGWRWAFGTPYNMRRQHSAGGSVASPLIISWPREMRGVAGGVRDQYHHAVDVVPTILDCAAIDPPPIIKGDTQAPIQGVSMRYTFTAPDAPSMRRTQRYEMPGARAIYHEGWKAVAGRSLTPGRRNGTAGAWELYHVGADRAEIHNLAARYPQKVSELVSLCAVAADRGGSPAHGEQREPEQLAGSQPPLPDRRAS
jgi:arylsulfatase A-like enzyme